MIRLFGSLLLLCLIASAAVEAATLDAVSRGWYRSDGLHGSTGNYGAGRLVLDETRDHNNYFVFDLSSVSGTVTAATLHLLMQPTASYTSPDPAETYAVYDVGTSIATLVAGTGGVAAYNDLGSGGSFGSAVITAADAGTFVNISLNALGIAYVNAMLGGQIAFGGAVTTLSGDFNQIVLGGAGITQGNVMSHTQLILTTIPLPGAVWLLGGALGVLGLVRRRVS